MWSATGAESTTTMRGPPARWSAPVLIGKGGESACLVAVTCALYVHRPVLRNMRRAFGSFGGWVGRRHVRFRTGVHTARHPELIRCDLPGAARQRFTTCSPFTAKMDDQTVGTHTQGAAACGAGVRSPPGSRPRPAGEALADCWHQTLCRVPRRTDETDTQEAHRATRPR